MAFLSFIKKFRLYYNHCLFYTSPNPQDQLQPPLPSSLLKKKKNHTKQIKHKHKNTTQKNQTTT
ncbi:hypothetical protein, partial [Helicobacter pylori]|uniref:hypothetical protein n=1 Tax=Helicobacter pylori TaxID=210 RepID=UPI0036F3FE64